MSHDPGLFPEPDEQSRELMEQLGRVLNKVSPLRTKHRADLAYAIRDLSRSLTDERDGRPREYMGEPRSASAYLRYFLPWNLYRLTRLFQGMKLNIPEGGTIIDLGAGPLTALLALWIAMPHLRTKRLTFVCMDRTPKPMKTGLEIFRKLDPNSPWKITLVKGGVHTKLREKADLLLAANTLNELDWKGGDGIYEQLSITARSLTNRLAKNGRILLIEPGVRDAARILALLRKEFIENGYTVLAPCTHTEECPMPGDFGGPWCHFRFEALSAPNWLKKLTAEAKLTKQAASLSFLYLAPVDPADSVEAVDPFDLAPEFGPEFDDNLDVDFDDELDHDDPLDAPAKPPESQNRPVPSNGTVRPVRVISQTFNLPEGQGQYGCSERGLVMIGYRYAMMPLPSGSLLAPHWPKEDLRDEKSGGLILPIGGSTPPERKPAGNAIDPSGTRKGRTSRPPKPGKK